MRSNERRAASGLGEVLFEFRRIGALLRVAAIDPVSGTEVTVSGPLARGEVALRGVALRKLAYVLARRQGPPRPSFFA